VSPVVLVEPVVEIAAASGALYEAADTSKSLPDKGIGYQDEGQLSAVRLAEGCSGWLVPYEEPTAEACAAVAPDVASRIVRARMPS
jgi:hypothetical protein